MTSQHTADQQAEIRLLDAAELDSVVGGENLMPIDISGMPDRAVGGCGTMWLLRHRGTIFTPQH